MSQPRPPDRPDDPLVRRVLLRLLRPFLPGDWEGDVTAELAEAHARRRERGPARADAWLVRQVVVFAARFSVERLRDGTADVARQASLETVLRDVRSGLRGMVRAPLFAVAVVTTLALSVGATTAIFSVVRAVLLEPLPYPAAERLLVVSESPWTPTPIVERVAATEGVFDAVAGYYAERHVVGGDERPEEVGGVEVTPNLLPLLGAELAAGRLLLPADGRADRPPTVVISHDLWTRRFGADPAAVGGTLDVDGRAREVVGVLAPGFRQLTPRVDDPDLWLPIRPEPGRHSGPDEWLVPLARRARGVSPERAQQALERAVDGWLATSPAEVDPTAPRWSLRWTALHDDLTRDARPALLVLQGAVALVLLLACVNVANLLLARFGSRRAEVAVRTVLGASRSRLLVQLVTESAVLALAGGVAAAAVLAGALELVVAVAPPDLPRLDRVAPDATVLALTLGLSLATGVVFGVLPALAATRRSPARVLRESGPGSGLSRRRHRLAQALVIAQVTLTVVLLAGAGLLVRTFATLSARDPGFRVSDVVAVTLRVREDAADDVPGLEAFQRNVRDALLAVPGVEGVGATNNLPMRRSGASRLYVVEGEEAERTAEYAVVSPGYFEAVDIPLLRGRGILPTDRRDAPAVAVVDEAMWREVWPGTDPLGARIRFVDEEAWITVVGVSAAVRGAGAGSEPEPGFHISWQQRPATATELAVGREVFYLVRSSLDLRELAPVLRDAVASIAPSQPVPEVRPLAAVLAAEIGPQRFRAVLVAAFALLALVLAVSGVYGVLGQLFEERSHELGVRQALGATRAQVLGRVLGWGMRLAAAGTALGLGGVAIVGPWLESLLFGVGPTDPATVGAAVATVLLATAAACLVPALRAVRLDAVRTLRAEG